MNKTVLVNYQGGYCGSFFCSLVAESLGVDFDLTTDPDLNIYFYNNKKIKTFYLKCINKIIKIRNNVITNKELSTIEDNDFDESYVYAKNLYNILKDEDDEVFIENIKNYFESLIDKREDEYFVSTIHYPYQYRNLDLHDIYPNASILHIVADKKRHARYFHLLFHFKTKDHPADKILQTSTLNQNQIYKDFVEIESPQIFDDKSIPVDMGKLIFERDFAHLSVVEEALSKEVGKSVKLDRMKLNAYADRNVDIIKKILGADFESQSEEEQIKNCYSYVENIVRAAP